MTRYFIAASFVLLICIAVECLPDSSDDADSLANQRDDNEIADGDDVDRMGSAQAKAFASVTRLRPGVVAGPPVKFVNCYACVDCPKALANTSAKYCPYTNDPTKSNKCVVYAEKYAQMKKIWYIRGCASERGSCSDIRRGHDNNPSVKLTMCAECEGDRCNTNGVSQKALDLTTAILVLFIPPILGKYILT